MSLILDALRKSELERRQAEPLVPPSLPADTVASRRRLAPPFAVLTALVLLLAAGSWAWFAGRDTTSIDRPESASSGVRAPVPDAASSKTTPDVPAAPPLTVNPFVAAERESLGVRDLAQEARVPPAPAASVSSRPAPRVASRSPALAADEGTTGTAVKFLRAMPPEFQRGLPELVVNIHIYAPRPADRILYINNRQYQAGDKVRDDIVVEAIMEDGAVLSYRGQRFKLPRPS